MKQVAYFSNQPSSLEQQPFFQSLRDTASREGKLRGAQILQEQLSRLPRHEHLKGVDADKYARILAAHGVDLNYQSSTGGTTVPGLLGNGVTPTGGGQTPSQPMLGDTVRVRNKQTGQTGTMPKANFNPQLYDAVQ